MGQGASQDYDEATHTAIHVVVAMVNLVIIIPIVLSLCCLFVYQVCLVTENVTTIEEYEKKALKKRAKQQGKVWNNCCLFNLEPGKLKAQISITL